MDQEIEQKNINTAFILENITQELEEFILDETEADAEDGLFNTVEDITNKLQENCEGLINEDSDKRCFMKPLTQIFSLSLNTKVDNIHKIKKILRTAVETRLKIW